MTKSPISRAVVALGCASIAAAAAVVYLPGLGGGFAFDDYQVIVGNDALNLTDVSVTAVLDAAFSSNTGPLKRPLAMLSFAVNHRISGLEPLGYKITNLGIHALNGVLLFLLLLKITPRLRRPAAPSSFALAWFIAALWAVHPLNLTSVLYVVQRMTSLSATWVLAACWLYVCARERQIERRPVPPWQWSALAGCAACGALTKEPALLLPLYLWVIEITALHFEGAGVLRRVYNGTFAIVAVAVAAMFLFAPDIIFGGYHGRPFTWAERGFTELRVLLGYLRLLLLPALGGFTLFHDDFAISRSLVAPLTMLWAGAVLAALVLAAWRTKLAALRFGVAWFLLGHALESTIYPLELMHEHRNYLPAIGPLLALVVGAHAVLERRCAGRLQAGLGTAVVLLFAALTALRADIWSDPRALVEFEAAHHPRSARNSYEAGRVRVLQAGADNFALHASGIALLERSLALTSNPKQPISALVMVAADDRDRARLERMLAILRDQPLRMGRVRVVRDLVYCQGYGKCRRDPAVVLELVENILANPTLSQGARWYVLEWLAVYYARVLGDQTAAIRVLEDAWAQAPRSRELPLRLAEVLRAYGNSARALMIARGVREQLPWHAAISARPLLRRLRQLESGPIANE